MEKRSATRFEAGFKETDGCVEVPEVEKDTLKRCYGVLKKLRNGWYRGRTEAFGMGNAIRFGTNVSIEKSERRSNAVVYTRSLNSGSINRLFR